MTTTAAPKVKPTARTKKAKPTTLKEEKEAKAAEATKVSKPITPSLLKAVQEVHELKAKMAPMLARIEEVKAMAVSEMERKGAQELTRKGVPVVSLDTAKKTVVDIADIREKYPKVAALYIHTESGERINWKKPVDL